MLDVGPDASGAVGVVPDEAVAGLRRLRPGIEVSAGEAEFRYVAADFDDVLVYVKNAKDPANCGLARASVPLLWPPDHKMAQVEIEGVADKGDAKEDIVVKIVGVTQDEPLFGQKDGDSSPDAVVLAGPSGDTLLLRAERAEGGNGRVYRVSFTADDGFKACQGSVDVAVPPIRTKSAIDDGQRFKSATK